MEDLEAIGRVLDQTEKALDDVDRVLGRIRAVLGLRVSRGNRSLSALFVMVGVIAGLVGLTAGLVIAWVVTR